MNATIEREYYSLATEENRRILIADMKKVRQEALLYTQIVPQEKWYEPRYHGWSLAFLLAHLQMMDNLTRQLMQAAMLGISLPSTMGLVNFFNDSAARLFKQRKVENAIRQIQQDEPKLIAFVLKATHPKLGRRLYDPAIDRVLTVEQAMQEFFVYHWRWHIEDIAVVDGRMDEPSISNQV
ncbi:MAG: hypothetical protein K8L97_09270 [Anaerolineae bacterium]|nr:hypothetical protein [Anaerolineae bacterium]